MTLLVQRHVGTDRVEAGNQHLNIRLTLRGWNHAMIRAAAVPT